MVRRSETVEWLCERLAPLGTIKARSMFGGWGLYCDGLFFALVVDEVLHVKVDDVSRPAFVAERLSPFTYSMKDGRVQSLSYYPLPDSTLDDDPELLRWARQGLAAALRAAALKAGKRKR